MGGAHIWIFRKLKLKSAKLENEANMGGAIHCSRYTTLNVTNIFLQGNKAAHDGGGISMIQSYLIVRGHYARVLIPSRMPAFSMCK